MESPELEFRDGVAWSGRFDDRYFSAEGGFAETRHVFLEGNDLPARFARSRAFTVGELGFGTGANALACARLWLDRGLRYGSGDVGVLHYLTFERYPVGAGAVRAVAAAEPGVADLAEELADALPPAVEGLHRASLAGGRIVVTWVFGDARAWLPRLATRGGGIGVGAGVDAWFLDGFAPSRNPELWEPGLLAAVARASREDATFATYTVAGAVRRALDAAGFEAERRPGFGTKREMLAGSLRKGIGRRDALVHGPGRVGDGSPVPFREKPWHAAPRPPVPRDEISHRTAVVVGGGLAGTIVACRLAEAGLRVTLLERERSLATGASANPSAVLMPVVTADGDTVEQVSFAGFELAARRLRGLERDRERDRGAADHAPIFDPCGVLHLPRDDRFALRFEAAAGRRGDPPEVSRIVGREEASRLAGVPLETGGIWYERGGVVDLGRLCEALVARAGDRVRVEPTRDVLALSGGLMLVRRPHKPPKVVPGGPIWKVVSATADGEVRTDTACVVVYAGGFDLAALPGAEALPVRPIRGQIAEATASEDSAGLRCVLCRDGYVVPARGGRLHVGATYDRVDLDVSAGSRDDESLELVDRLRAWSPAFADVEAASGGGWTAVRAQTPDRLPIAGAMPDVRFFREAYADLCHARGWQRYPEARYESGLFASVGHGSRGAVTAFLAAELVVSIATSAPLPVPADVADALAPARFLLRDLKRPPEARSLVLPPLD